MTSRRRRESHASRLRRQVLAEWHGGEEPPDPEANLHLATEFLDRILREAGLTEGIEEERLRALWREIAGTMVANNSTPHSLKNGCLTLRVLQPALRHELEQTKTRLLANLRRELGNNVVKSIRFTIG